MSTEVRSNVPESLQLQSVVGPPMFLAVSIPLLHPLGVFCVEIWTQVGRWLWRWTKRTSPEREVVQVLPLSVSIPTRSCLQEKSWLDCIPPCQACSLFFERTQAPAFPSSTGYECTNMFDRHFEMPYLHEIVDASFFTQSPIPSFIPQFPPHHFQR